MGARHCPAVNHAQGAGCPRTQTCRHHVRHTEARHRVRASVVRRGQRSETETSSQWEHDPREGATDGADSVARPDHERPVRFQPSRLAPSDPIKRHRARRERSHPKEMLTTQTSAGALDLLENEIGAKRKTNARFEAYLF